MTPGEHYAEAERLLALAERLEVVVTVPGPLSAEHADRLKAHIRATLGVDYVSVLDGGATMNVSAIIGAAQAHAALAAAGVVQ
jgi:hypothetical protein